MPLRHLHRAAAPLGAPDGARTAKQALRTLIITLITQPLRAGARAAAVAAGNRSHGACEAAAAARARVARRGHAENTFYNHSAVPLPSRCAPAASGHARRRVLRSARGLCGGAAAADAATEAARLAGMASTRKRTLLKVIILGDSGCVAVAGAPRGAGGARRAAHVVAAVSRCLSA